MQIHSQAARPLFVFGHRGAAGHAPENTLAAIRMALDFGADGVEFDVRLAAGALIVLHDESLDRTTSGSGHYKSMTLPDLRALDAGAGERIPLLGEVIDLVGERADLNVEIKEAGIANVVIDFLLARLAPTSRPKILLSSFDESTTRQLAARRGAMRLGVLYHGDFAPALARARDLNAWSIHLPLKQVSGAVVAAAHAADLRAYVYTVNELADIERCAAANVDGVFSDYPDGVIAFNRRINMPL